MTAQGVLNGAGATMGAAIFGLSVPGSFVKETGSSFEQFMESSKEEVKTAAQTQQKDGKETTVQQKSVKERAKDMFSGKNNVKKADKPQVKDSVEEFEKVAEAVSLALVQVRQTICETLTLTEEQLTAAMDGLGLQDSDLLERGSMQQLFLTVKQAESTEFLTNEELFGGFADLMQAVEQTMTEFNISPEEFRTVLARMETEEPVGQEIAETFLQEETAKLPEQVETEEGDVSDLPTESTMEAPKATVVSEDKTQSGDTGDKEQTHTALARKEGKTTVISSEADVAVKTVFIDALASYTTNGVEEASLEVVAQVREIANQIMEQIKITIRPDQTNMELQLNPEHLGRVNLTITEKEGRMTAQFTTQTEIAKEAIESQMAALRESLQNQGIKVENIEVTVAEFGFARDGNAKQNGEGESGKQKHRASFHIDEAEEGSLSVSELLNVTDSSVDYSA